jgi:hypothetical protein
MKIKPQNHIDNDPDLELIVYKLTAYMYSIGGSLTKMPTKLSKEESNYILNAYDTEHWL